jgi:hypothetical protein
MNSAEIMPLIVYVFTTVALGTSMYKAFKGQMKASAGWGWLYATALSIILLLKHIEEIM